MKISLVSLFLTQVFCHSDHQHGIKTEKKFKSRKYREKIEKFKTRTLFHSSSKQRLQAAAAKKKKEKEAEKKLEKFEQKYSESSTLEKIQNNLENNQIATFGSYDVPRHTNECKI